MRFRRLRVVDVTATVVVLQPHTDLMAGWSDEDRALATEEGWWETFHELILTGGERNRRDAVGRARRNSWGHRWVPLQCNNPECSASVDVREDVLLNAGARAEWQYTHDRD